mgnify:CR=1 FL=1
MIEVQKIEYTVTVFDGFGAPISGVEVSFMSGNTEAAKVKTDKNGKAAAKLVSGEYTVEVLSDALVPSAESYKVNDASPSLKIKLVALAILTPMAKLLEKTESIYF